MNTLHTLQYNIVLHPNSKVYLLNISDILQYLY